MKCCLKTKNDCLKVQTKHPKVARKLSKRLICKGLLFLWIEGEVSSQCNTIHVLECSHSSALTLPNTPYLLSIMLLPTPPKKKKKLFEYNTWLRVMGLTHGPSLSELRVACKLSRRLIWKGFFFGWIEGEVSSQCNTIHGLECSHSSALTLFFLLFISVFVFINSLFL